MARKYYWLKLEQNYLTSPKIKKLRKIAGGDTYTIIYLKMQLLSIEKGGIIDYEGIEPTFEEELSLILDEEVDNVKVTLSFLLSQGLIYSSDDNSFLLPEAADRIGTESESKARVQAYRERQKGLKSVTCNKNVTECNASVTESNTDIDIDIDIEKEKEKESNKPAKAGKGTFDNIKKMIAESSLDDEVKEEAEKWLEYKKERKDKYTEIGFKSLLTKIEKKCNEFGNDAVIDVIENSIVSGYQGIIWDKLKKGGNNGTVSKKDEDEFDYNFGLVL